MTQSAQILSVQVGKPQTLAAVEEGGKPWRSAIYKTSVDGPVWARALGLDGDAQADHRHHGGEAQAINVYPAEHYEVWRATPGLEAMTGGAFGENFTTLGMSEHTTFLGDVMRVGEAVVQVTQPRGPCYKLNRRWNNPDLQSRAEQEYRFGWYLRVMEEGRVQAGDRFELLDRPHPDWSIARVWDVTTGELDTPETVADARALMDIALLGKNWRRALEHMLKNP